MLSVLFESRNVCALHRSFQHVLQHSVPLDVDELNRYQAWEALPDANLYYVLSWIDQECAIASQHSRESHHPDGTRNTQHPPAKQAGSPSTPPLLHAAKRVIAAYAKSWHAQRRLSFLPLTRLVQRCVEEDSLSNQCEPSYLDLFFVDDCPTNWEAGFLENATTMCSQLLNATGTSPPTREAVARLAARFLAHYTNVFERCDSASTSLGWRGSPLRASVLVSADGDWVTSGGVVHLFVWNALWFSLKAESDEALPVERLIGGLRRGASSGFHESFDLLLHQDDRLVECLVLKLRCWVLLQNRSNLAPRNREFRKQLNPVPQFEMLMDHLDCNAQDLIEMLGAFGIVVLEYVTLFMKVLHTHAQDLMNEDDGHQTLFNFLADFRDKLRTQERLIPFNTAPLRRRVESVLNEWGTRAHPAKRMKTTPPDPE